MVRKNFNIKSLILLILFSPIICYSQEIPSDLKMYKHGISPEVDSKEIFNTDSIKIPPITYLTSNTSNYNINHYFFQNMNNNDNILLSPISFNLGYNFKLEIMNGIILLNYVFYIDKIKLEIVITPVRYRFITNPF